MKSNDPLGPVRRSFSSCCPETPSPASSSARISTGKFMRKFTASTTRMSSPSSSSSSSSSAGAASPCFTSSFPYTGPSHDPQKLMRASLVSSCLRGQMRVWQFQGGGVKGREVRRLPHRWRWGLLRGGVFHRVCGERVFRGEEHLRPVYGTELLELGQALGRGHTEMVEWCMHTRAFHYGLSHPSSNDRAYCYAPLPKLMCGACKVDWSWGRSQIEGMVARSDDDPNAVAMRVSGGYATMLAVACAAAGSANSLQWAEHYAREAPLALLSRQLNRPRQGIVENCTLAVAEWIMQVHWRASTDSMATHNTAPDDPGPWVSELVEEAAGGGNWTVMEWLVRRYGCTLDPFHPYLHSAAAHDSVAAMRFLCNHGLDRCTATAGNNATTVGSLSVLEWLWSEKPECVESNCLAKATEYGQVCKLGFLLDRCGFEWTEEHAVSAMQRGHTHVLEWAHDRGLALPSTLMRGYGDADSQTSTFRFLAAHAPSLRCDRSTMATACHCGLLAVEAIHRRFPEQLSQADDQHLLRQAMAGGHIAVIEFLFRHLPDAVGGAALRSVDVTAVKRACTHIELAKLVRAQLPHALDLPGALARATENGSLEVVEWLYAECGRPALVLEPGIAIRAGRLHILEYFLSERCEFDPQQHWGAGDVAQAVENSHTHVIEYLVAHGMINESTRAKLYRQAKRTSNFTRWSMRRVLRGDGWLPAVATPVLSCAIM